MRLFTPYPILNYWSGGGGVYAIFTKLILEKNAVYVNLLNKNSVKFAYTPHHNMINFE